jgi:hypothetical protein
MSRGGGLRGGGLGPARDTDRQQTEANQVSGGTHAANMETVVVLSNCHCRREQNGFRNRETSRRQGQRIRFLDAGISLIN